MTGVDIVKNNLLDLRELLLTMNAAKPLRAHLCTDLNCTIPATDARPLAAAMYTLIHMLQRRTDGELSIDLDEHKDRYQLTMTAYSPSAIVISIPERLQEVLHDYDATVQCQSEDQSWIKLVLSFKKP